MRRLCILAVLAAAATTAPAHAEEWKCDQRVENDRRLRLLGEIKQDEFDRFSAGFSTCFPRQYQGQRTVELFSGGGSVGAALAISKALIEAGSGSRPIFTRVRRGSYCISACTYIFVSGRLRDVETGGSFEPHGFSSFVGERIDDAIEANRQKGEKLDIQVQRFALLFHWLTALAKGDDRFDWTNAWFNDIANTPLQKDESIQPAIARAFLKLNTAQRTFIANTDAIIAAAMPELERVAALEGFAPLLAEAAGRAATRTGGPKVDEKTYMAWVTGEFTNAARIYLAAIKDGRKPVIGEEFLTQVLTQQRQRAESVRNTVEQALGPYLLSRGDQVDVAGFVTLMFSTSILYTRPLTREEMCDLNIVNRDCAN